MSNPKETMNTIKTAIIFIVLWIIIGAVTVIAFLYLYGTMDKIDRIHAMLEQNDIQYNLK